MSDTSNYRVSLGLAGRGADVLVVDGRGGDEVLALTMAEAVHRLLMTDTSRIMNSIDVLMAQVEQREEEIARLKAQRTRMRDLLKTVDELVRSVADWPFVSPDRETFQKALNAAQVDPPRSDWD